MSPMRANDSADNIEVLNQDVQKTKFDVVKERTTQLRNRFLKILRRKKIPEKTKETKENVDHQNCHGQNGCHICCFMKHYPTFKGTERRPVLYKVIYEDVLYENRKKCNFFKSSKERSASRHNYKCFLKDDFVQRSWESALKRHSDMYPIIYNSSLWTTSTSARKRLQKIRKSPTCPRIERDLYTRVQTLRIEKQYVNNPQRRSYYKVEKKSLVQLHQKSIAQWRF